METDKGGFLIDSLDDRYAVVRMIVVTGFVQRVDYLSVARNLVSSLPPFARFREFELAKTTAQVQTTAREMLKDSHGSRAVTQAIYDALDEFHDAKSRMCDPGLHIDYSKVGWFIPEEKIDEAENVLQAIWSYSADLISNRCASVARVLLSLPNLDLEGVGIEPTVVSLAIRDLLGPSVGSSQQFAFSNKKKAETFIKAMTKIEDALWLLRPFLHASPEEGRPIQKEDVAREMGPDYQLRNRGNCWRIVFEKEEGYFSDCKGLQYLHRLLQWSPKPIRVELVENPNLDPMSLPDSSPDGDEILDQEAFKDLEKSLKGMQAELAQPDLLPNRRKELEESRDRISMELHKSTDRFGRKRRLSKGVKNAMDRVRNNITNFLDSEETKRMQKFTKHMVGSLSFGKFCKYEPSEKISWTL